MKKYRLWMFLVSAGVFWLGCESAHKRLENQPLRIVVGMEGDYAPFNWTTLNENGEYTHPFTGQVGYASGYDVMMAKRIADALDAELIIRKISWDGLIFALNSNTIDLIIAGMSPTAERMRAISFSDPYFQSQPELVIIVRKDSKYADATLRSDFSGAVITAQQGTYHAAVLDQLPDIRKTTLLTDYVALMQSLRAGVIDGYLTEKVVAQEHVNAHSDFTMVLLSGDEVLMIPPEQGSVAIGMRKQDQHLLQAVNEILATISEEERLAMMEQASVLAATLY